MKKSKRQIYKEFFAVIFIIWLFLGVFLLYENAVITGKLTYVPAQGGTVTRVDLVSEQNLWKGVYGTIRTGNTTNNTLTIDYSNTSSEIFHHDLIFPDNCRYGRLIMTTNDDFTYTAIRQGSHANHDAYLGLPPYGIASADVFSQTRTYDIGTYDGLSLYTAQLNAALGYFYQSFGMYGISGIFYITPTVNNGKGFNGNDANYQLLIPHLGDTTSYYFYFDNTTCQPELNTTNQQPEEEVQVLLSVQVPEKICINKEVELLGVDLNKRIYCLNREDQISQSQCREIPDADIEIFYGNEQDATESLTTDDNALAYFTPTREGFYTFKISTTQNSGEKTTYAGQCNTYDTIVVETKYNYTNQSTQGSYIETPTTIEPVQGPIFSPEITKAVSIAWGVLSLPLFLGLLMLYYVHYRNSAKWLLKLRIYLAQARINAEERSKK